MNDQNCPLELVPGAHMLHLIGKYKRLLCCKKKKKKKNLSRAQKKYKKEAVNSPRGKREWFYGSVMFSPNMETFNMQGIRAVSDHGAAPVITRS